MFVVADVFHSTLEEYYYLSPITYSNSKYLPENLVAFELSPLCTQAFPKLSAS